MRHLDGNPIPLAIAMLVLGPAYLWWPQVAGPALFCFLPVLLLMLAVKTHNNSRRQERLEHLSARPSGLTDLDPATEPRCSNSETSKG
jgi:hypothetical protein